MRLFLIFILAIATISNAYPQRSKKKRKNKTEMAVASSPEELAIKIEATLIEAEKHLVLDNYTKAVELLQTVLTLDAKNSAANFKLAEILTKEGQFSEALTYADAALNADPENKYFYLLKAEIYKAQGDLKNAAELYDEMIQGISGTDSYLYDLAIIYQYMGDFDKALQNYEKAEDIFGINEIALKEKQKIYLQRGDIDALLADWDQLISENPDETDYVIEISEFLINRGRTADASERLNQVKEFNIEVELLKSMVAFREGEMKKALDITFAAFNAKSSDFSTKIQLLNNYMENALEPEQFQAVIKMANQLREEFPKKFEAQAYAGDVLYRMEEKGKAQEAYLSALEIDGAHFNVWQNVLNIDAEMADYDQLIAHSDEALEYFPNQALLYYFSGTGHLVKKNFKKSVTMLETGSKYASDPALLTLFYGQLGDAYNGLKKTEKSFESYDIALTHNPNNDHVLNNYSYFLSLGKKDLEKALEMSTRLVAQHPDNPTYLDTHGWVLYTLDRFIDAEGFLKKAASLEKNGTIVEHYGDVLFQLGKVDEAVKQWQIASKLSDASENIEKKIAEKTLYE